jgi:hypothetical protein
VLRRLLARAGFRVVDRRERTTIDLDRFEHAADLLLLELEPVERPPVSLLIKACGMEADTLVAQVQHVVSQLESPCAFEEVVLTLDSRKDGFVRQHTAGDIDRLHAAALVLQAKGWIDRIVRAPEAGRASRKLNLRWLGQDRDDTHADNGAPLSAVFAGLEAVHTRYVLQVDVDVIIGRRDPGHDYVSDMLDAMEQRDGAVSVAFNIARPASTPYTEGEAGPWRIEVRNCLLHLQLLRSMLPLMPAPEGTPVPLPAWHRALDQRVRSAGAQSLRGGDARTFFVHPQNEYKASGLWYWRMLERISRGHLLPGQAGSVELAARPELWSVPSRFERFVFVIAGRNVSPGRFQRCLESVFKQRRKEWGAVVLDDDSHWAVWRWHEQLCHERDEQITFLHNPVRRGLLANTVEAIRHHVGNPDSVIVTLDADDCLIGDSVLDVLADAYAAGADMTVGSMCRTDKGAAYPVDFAEPRSRRGGNVWQHLRSFRKSLFDAVPDEELRIDGDYVDLASDWALMLPMVELARNPQWIRAQLYLHEPGDRRDAAYRAEREAVIARLMARPSLRALNHGGGGR